MNEKIIKQKGVIYLDKDKLDIYINKSSKILRLGFSAEVARDLEIIDKEKFYSLIKAFIDTYKIPVSNLVIMLAKDLIFDKDFQNQETEDKQNLEEIQKYLDTIPFETIGIKIIKHEKTTKVIAANRDFYQTIKAGFEKQGFIIESIIPTVILGNNNKLDATRTLDKESAQFILKKLDWLSLNSMPINENVIKEPEKNENNPLQNKRLLVMLILFGVLIIIFIVLLVNSFKPQKTTKNNTGSTTQSQVAVPTQATMENNPVSTSDANLNTSSNSGTLDTNIRIRIVNNTQNLKEAQKIKQLLESKGFSDIETQNNTSINTVKTLIIFSDRISKEMRDQITNMIIQVSPDASVQINNASQFDLSITVGKTG